MTRWAIGAMAELRDSLCRDLSERKIFAWFTRLRQPEELYIRTLYNLFVAGNLEMHHVISGAMPNGFAGLYEDVNRVVFRGRGTLLVSQTGLHFGSFKPKDMLNEGAHASYAAFMTCLGISKDPSALPTVDAYRAHLSRYCAALNYMNGMFKAGKREEDVLAGVMSLHSPRR